jgi:hypothetical protein
MGESTSGSFATDLLDQAHQLIAAALPQQPAILQQRILASVRGLNRSVP